MRKISDLIRLGARRATPNTAGVFTAYTSRGKVAVCARSPALGRLTAAVIEFVVDHEITEPDGTVVPFGDDVWQGVLLGMLQQFGQAGEGPRLIAEACRALRKLGEHSTLLLFIAASKSLDGLKVKVWAELGTADGDMVQEFRLDELAQEIMERQGHVVPWPPADLQPPQTFPGERE